MSEAWFKSLQKFEPSAYATLSLNDMVVFSVLVLSEQHRDINFEDIVAACFTMFPERFCLRGYPDWPDSTVVNKRWLDCRDRALILGSTKDGFSITAKGVALAEKARIALQSKSTKVNAGGRGLSEHRTRAGRFVRALETSDAYRRFQSEGKVDAITEFEFRSMLLCTMESTSEVLRSNIEQFKQFAAVYARGDLIDFLKLLEQKFAGLIQLSVQRVGVVRGGMVPKHKKR